MTATPTTGLLADPADVEAAGWNTTPAVGEYVQYTDGDPDPTVWYVAERLGGGHYRLEHPTTGEDGFACSWQLALVDDPTDN